MIAMLALALLAGAQQPPKAKEEKPKIVEGLPEGTYAWFKTNHGEFVTKLFTDLTPIATSNFIGLAEGTKKFMDPKTMQVTQRPFYDGLIFQRIIAGFMIQGGDPLGTGEGGPGYHIRDEITPKLRFDKPGLLAYANSGTDTSGSQIFITVSPQPALDPSERGHYTIFGEVVKGMEVVLAISKVPCDKSDPQSPRPLTPVVMEKVRIYKVGAAAKPADAKTSATQSK